MDGRAEIQAKAEHFKMRLEDFLLDHFSSLSKMYLRELVKTAKCEVNGRHENIGYKLRVNDFVEISYDSTRGTAMRQEDISLDIVYEDADLILVNKPAGMLVHPSHRENSGTLLNALSFYLNRQPGKLIRPGLIHRLDKQTSGLILVAKNGKAHSRLCSQFMKKRVEKRYLALVDGVIEDESGTIQAPIGRFAEQKLWGVKPDGKHSETRYWVKKRFDDRTLIELEPVTGRTNQLRIHCAMIGHPIVGDTAREGSEFPRLCLHAYKLGFDHPTTHEHMKFEIDMPDDFKRL